MGTQITNHESIRIQQEVTEYATTHSSARSNSEDIGENLLTKAHIEQTHAHTMCLAPRIKDAGSRNSAPDLLDEENLAASSSGKKASSMTSCFCKH